MIAIQPSMRRTCTNGRTRLVIPWSIRWESRAFPDGRGVEGVSAKNFDTQRERHLQPLVDGIGASEQETCCNQIRDEPEKQNRVSPSPVCLWPIHTRSAWFPAATGSAV